VVRDVYEGGPQMLGPSGEPWQTIEGFDESGEVQQIQLHNGHSFDDGTSFGPHYKNPLTKFHLSTVPMSASEFGDLFLGLPWQWVGKI
jgi:hypothetical protein